MSEPKDTNLNRREFVVATTALGIVASLPAFAKNEELIGRVSNTDPLPVAETVHMVDLKISVNGKNHDLKVDTRETLLDVVRERLALTGSKKGCDHGQCGACTMIVDGKRINSCLSLAVQNQNTKVTTIEGLETNGKLHPVQAAFVKHDAFQCGFCTPGQIMSSVALLKENCGKSNEAVRECMSGNICRCGAYNNIINAIQEVRHGAQHA